MKDRALKMLARLDGRVLLVAMTAVVAFAAIEAWMLVLRKPLLELSNQTSVQAELAATTDGDSRAAAQIERLAAELPRLEQEFAGGHGGRSDDGTILFLMDALGRIATRNGVGLGSVRPGSRRIVHGFEESTYDIEVRGDYRSLYQWLREAQPGTAPLVVTGFTLRALDDGSRLALALKLADYRPVTVAGGAP